MFAIAPMITSYFSQDETQGGQGKLDVRTRGAWTIVNGRRARGPRVKVPGIVGNSHPARAKDIDAYAEGKVVEGDRIFWTVKEVPFVDEKSQDGGSIVLHNGTWYRLDTLDDWTYAGGFRYVGRRERDESGV